MIAPQLMQTEISRRKARAHFYTWSATMYRALCEATARTSESPGRLRRYAPYKGLHPLRRFAAIPAHLTERHIRFASASFHQV